MNKKEIIQLALTFKTYYELYTFFKNKFSFQEDFNEAMFIAREPFFNRG